MVHQDKDKAGPGLPSLCTTYTQVNIKHLTEALNDKGPPGLIIHSTPKYLLLQDKAIGVTLQQPANKRCLRQVSHYHLARQLTILRQAQLRLQMPEGHAGLEGKALTTLLADIKYDPNDLGLQCTIPAEVC